LFKESKIHTVSKEALLTFPFTVTSTVSKQTKPMAIVITSTTNVFDANKLNEH